jgi:hypothetical protein
MLPQPRREARYRFHRRTPWLYFRRDHPLKVDTVRHRPRPQEYDDTADLYEYWNAFGDDDDDDR